MNVCILFVRILDYYINLCIFISFSPLQCPPTLTLPNPYNPNNSSQGIYLRDGPTCWTPLMQFRCHQSYHLSCPLECIDITSFDCLKVSRFQHLNAYVAYDFNTRQIVVDTIDNRLHYDTVAIQQHHRWQLSLCILKIALIDELLRNWKFMYFYF